MDLPFEFNQIINYDTLNNIQSDFIGYAYDSENNNIQLNISNLSKYKSQDIYDEYANILNDSIRTTEKVRKLETKLNKIEEDISYSKDRLKNGIDANETPIKAGLMGNVLIDENGIVSFDRNNPNNMIRIAEDNIGISKSGLNDFEPIFNSDGIINPKFLPNIYTNQDNEKTDKVENIQGSQGNQEGSTSSGQNSSTQIINNKYVTNNPKIIYENLPFKIIRNQETKKVEKIEYYRDKKLAYVEIYIRNENNKIASIELKSIDTGEIQTTTLERGEDNKVNFVDINKNNESVVE